MATTMTDRTAAVQGAMAQESFDALMAEAAEAPAGSEGLLFPPYLSGERTPYPDPLARGSFVGLTLRHKRAHLTRAVLEGVAFKIGRASCRERVYGLV